MSAGGSAPRALTSILPDRTSASMYAGRAGSAKAVGSSSSPVTTIRSDPKPMGRSVNRTRRPSSRASPRAIRTGTPIDGCRAVASAMEKVPAPVASAGASSGTSSLRREVSRPTSETPSGSVARDARRPRSVSASTSTKARRVSARTISPRMVVGPPRIRPSTCGTIGPSSVMSSRALTRSASWAPCRVSTLPSDSRIQPVTDGRRPTPNGPRTTRSASTSPAALPTWERTVSGIRSSTRVTGSPCTVAARSTFRVGSVKAAIVPANEKSMPSTLSVPRRTTSWSKPGGASSSNSVSTPIASSGGPTGAS